MLELILILNILWFGAGFHLFALRSRIFAKIIVAKEHRDTPVFDTLTASGKFLGGFNLAFAILNVLLLLKSQLFNQPLQWLILLMVIAIAHGTQFACNVPIAVQNLRGEGVWQVKGLMRFIFVVDFSLMVANAILAIYIAVA